ncbi:MAG TPA: hypothetical protein VD788_04730 [Candidatus Polarisedimenticolaceae bacterium]|nr:hypothetical protein [Candidatus Polarisedimenticolaceae bacterium]
MVRQGGEIVSSRNGSRSSSENGKHKSKRIELNADEVATLLAAIRRYRHTIPVYLASSKPELILLDAVIRKLR